MKRVKRLVEGFWMSSHRVAFALFWAVVIATTLVLLLSGCARNMIEIREIAPDGTQLVVRQETLSTYGSKTDEGVGEFHYEAQTGPESSFSMTAGAGVRNQQSKDPVESVLGIARLLAQLGLAQATQKEPAEPSPAPIEPPLSLRLREFAE